MHQPRHRPQHHLRQCPLGEFVGSSEGLGFLLLTATSQLDKPLAFAALFALSILGVLVYLLVEGVELLIAPWLPPAPERH
jgi:NitT/TauT family transport system permease protein